jgi:predicted transposase/invertase (TIGR01784 family)
MNTTLFGSYAALKAPVISCGDIAKTTPGLPEAREKLRKDKMTEAERSAYEDHLENLRYRKSVITTSIIEGHMKGKAEGLAEGKAEGERAKAMDVAAKALQMGMNIEAIIELTGLTPEKIAGLDTETMTGTK